MRATSQHLEALVSQLQSSLKDRTEELAKVRETNDVLRSDLSRQTELYHQQLADRRMESSSKSEHAASRVISYMTVEPLT